MARRRSAPMARQVGRSAALGRHRPHERLAHQHAPTDERGQREQEQTVALEVGDVPRLANAVEVGGVLDVHRVPEDAPDAVVKAGIAFAPPRRSTNWLTIWGMCAPYLA